MIQSMDWDLNLDYPVSNELIRCPYTTHHLFDLPIVRWEYLLHKGIVGGEKIACLKYIEML